MTPEGKIKKQVKEFLDELAPNVWYYTPVPMGYGRRGIPDFLGCCNGQFFSIETKTKSGILSPWQERENTNIQASGGLAVVFSRELGIEDFKKVFLQWAGMVTKH